MFTYLSLFIILLILELAYFKMADRFNIVDKPNERSSHSRVTLRGGGIIFYVGILLFFIYSGLQYPWFFAGLSIITIISFLDDLAEVRNLLRIAIHFTAVALLFVELNLFMHGYLLAAIAFIVTIGIINAWNFMDGINGITGGYSLLVLGALWYINQYQVPFISSELILFSMVALVVFNIFNFRKNARCFAGDVGSVSISFIILFCLISLIITSNNPIYILLLSVYGVDSVLTILHRLGKRENIFEAHRSHLYQYLSNEKGFGHLPVSVGYIVVQALFIVPVLVVADMDISMQIISSILILAVLSGVYVAVKWWVFLGGSDFERE